MRNNIGLGILGGVVACLVAAAIWAGVAVMTGMMIGWIAIGVGFLVGLGVRIGGEGTTPVFGVIGAVLALVGTALGNVFAVLGFVSQELEVGYFELLGQFDWSATFELLGETAEPMDVLFYGLAAWMGYKTGWFQDVMPEEEGGIA